VVNDVMYFTTPMEQVVALHATTGEKIWEYDRKERFVRVSRGVSYWPGDRQTSPRIVFGTSDGRLVALDAKTGTKIDSFGDHGEVDLKKGVTDGFPNANYTVTSPPPYSTTLPFSRPQLKRDLRWDRQAMVIPERSTFARESKYGVSIPCPRPGECGQLLRSGSERPKPFCQLRRCP
jgi:glucose dehydrogenase